MDDNKLIKPIADWIAKQHPADVIICNCADNLIDDYAERADGYYEIEDFPDDGFLGCDEWLIQLKITPETSTHYEGGYIGCDLSDCDCIIDDVTGVEDCEVKYVGYTDADGCEIEFDEHQKELLREELLKLWRK